MTDLASAFEESLKISSESPNSDLAKKFTPTDLNKEQTAEFYQWLTLSADFDKTGLDQLNSTLKERTFLLDTPAASLCDVIVLSRVLPIVRKWTVEDISKARHVIRWADLIQHVAEIKPEDRIKVDFDLDLPREIKVKEKKGEKGEKGEKTDKSPAKGKGAEQASKKTDTASGAGAAGGAGAAVAAKGKPSPEELERLKAEKKAKKDKAKQEKAKNAPAAAPAAAAPNPGMIDLRVGHIQKAIKHPDADKLYVSTIDMGDADGPRTVCSGLVNYYSLEEMQNRMVVTVANLKPVNMKGVKSSAMVLCASEGEIVQFVNPPEGAKPGDKVFFETYDSTPEPVLNPKKKIWEAVQPGFTTNENLEVVYKKDGEPDRKLVLKDGSVPKVKSLVGAAVR